MLVIGRKKNQGILVGDRVRVVVLDSRGEQVRLGIEAPREISILRQELAEELALCNRTSAALEAAEVLGLLERPEVPGVPEVWEPPEPLRALGLSSFREPLRRLAGWLCDRGGSLADAGVAEGVARVRFEPGEGFVYPLPPEPLEALEALGAWLDCRIGPGKACQVVVQFPISCSGPHRSSPSSAAISCVGA